MILLMIQLRETWFLTTNPYRYTSISALNYRTGLCHSLRSHIQGSVRSRNKAQSNPLCVHENLRHRIAGHFDIILLFTNSAYKPGHKSEGRQRGGSGCLRALESTINKVKKKRKCCSKQKIIGCVIVVRTRVNLGLNAQLGLGGKIKEEDVIFSGSHQKASEKMEENQMLGKPHLNLQSSCQLSPHLSPLLSPENVPLPLSFFPGLSSIYKIVWF